MPRRSFLAYSLLLLVYCVQPVLGRTWDVFEDGTGDAQTISAAIDSAAVGDTVLVGPGTYLGTVDFSGKDIVLKSASGPDATTLDAGSNDFAVVLQSGETRAAQIDGFRVTGARIGIILSETQPTIENNIIEGNSNAGVGAGIFCGGASGGPYSPLIQNNTIRNNYADLTSSGIGVFSRMNPEIIDNVIENNTARRGDGGGIYLRTSFSGSIIRGNEISGNFAGDHGGGVYVLGLVSNLGLEITENLVWDNVAEGQELTGESGGGLWLENTDAWVHHNTIVESTGLGPNNNYGGGIACQQPGTPTIENNIIAYTQAGGAIYCHSGISPIIENNLAWQNSGGPGAGLCADWINGVGNIEADPQFCDLMNGDFTLAEHSPALTHPSGYLGAFEIPGCAPTVVEAVTWSRVKQMLGTHEGR